MNLTPEKLAKVVELAELRNIANEEMVKPLTKESGRLHYICLEDLPKTPSPSYLKLHGYISSLSDRERNDLMCLMYFGRDMEYEQINHGKPLRSLRKAYLKDIRLGPGHYGCINPDYLAGKAPLSKWIRAAVAAMPNSLVWWRYKKALQKQKEQMTMALQTAYR